MKSHALTAAGIGLILLGATALAQTDQGTEQEAGQEVEQGTGQEAEPEAEQEAGASGQPAEAAEAAEAAEYGLDTTLAEVDGTELTLGELIFIRRELPEQYQALPDDVLLDGLLEQMIDQYLLAEAARERGLDEKPAVTISLVTQQRAILADAYLRAEVEKRATEERVEELYRERYVEAEPEDEVRAAHIVVETEEEARQIKAELDASADFAELAREHGTDSTAQRGGQLGWVVQSDMGPELAEFAETAFAMEPGTISEPVETAFGWHIIKVEERRQRTPPPLEEVRGKLMQEVVRDAQAAIVDELRAGANIDKAEAPVPPEAIRADGLLDPAAQTE